MRTIEECIDPRVGQGELRLQVLVDGVDHIRSVEAKSDASLIGHHDHSRTRTIQPGYRFSNSRKELKICDCPDVASFRHLFIDHAIPVEKHGLEFAAYIVRLRKHVCYDSSAIRPRTGRVSLA